MLSIKKLLTAALCLGSLAGSVAYADGLTIDNQTDYFSTAVMNNGACSNFLGDEGITKPHDVNTVSENKLRLACLGHWSDCLADVYMTNNCTGPIVGKVHFSLYDGILSVDVAEGQPFEVDYQGFKATIRDKAAA